MTIEDKRRSRRLKTRATGAAPMSSAALSESAAATLLDRRRRPKLKLKLPSDLPPGEV